MALENDLVTLLRAVCPRTYALKAPSNVEEPYCTWQHAGGQTLRAFDNSPFNIRNSIIQVTVWDSDYERAMTVIRQMEEALCTNITVTFVVEPQGEPTIAFDDLMETAGALQRFSISGSR